MSTMLKLNMTEKLPMVEILSGIIRIFSDLQREESAVRRSLIMKNINVSLRDTLASPDEWLFGTNLEEKIKATKTLEVFSKNLKPQKSYPTDSEGSKNWRGPPRRHHPIQHRYKQTYKTSGERKPGTFHEERTPSRKLPYQKKHN